MGSPTPKPATVLVSMAWILGCSYKQSLLLHLTTWADIPQMVLLA